MDRLMSVIIPMVDEHCLMAGEGEQFYEELIELLEDQGCDTLNECLEENPAFDMAYYYLHPERQEEDHYDESQLPEAPA